MKNSNAGHSGDSKQIKRIATSCYLYRIAILAMMAAGVGLLFVTCRSLFVEAELGKSVLQASLMIVDALLIGFMNRSLMDCEEQLVVACMRTPMTDKDIASADEPQAFMA